MLYCQDLNLQPQLHEELDASYDVVLCVNGIQYLTQPETVLCEVSNILCPSILCWHCCRIEGCVAALNVSVLQQGAAQGSWQTINLACTCY